MFLRPERSVIPIHYTPVPLARIELTFYPLEPKARGRGTLVSPARIELASPA